MLGVRRHRGHETRPEGTAQVTEEVEIQRRDLIAEALRLQREAGRQEQAQRAKAGLPPRDVLRALASVQKPGRRGRKARAKVKRQIVKHLGIKEESR